MALSEDQRDDMLKTIAQRQEDFYSEQREFMGKIQRTVFGEKDGDTIISVGLVTKVESQSKKIDRHDGLFKKGFWIGTGFIGAFEFFKWLLTKQ